MKSGIAFHCHHDKLFEYVYDYDERVKYIKESKPKNEVDLRLRLFKMIPEDLLPGRESIKWKKYIKAWRAYIQKYEKDFITLHEKLCPECPWNGESIF